EPVAELRRPRSGFAPARAGQSLPPRGRDSVVQTRDRTLREYRRIKGIDDFNRTPLIDERDLVADTNEVEYGVTNRFFVKRQTGDGSEQQTHELLNLTVSQKYFFDPTFGGALQRGQRNQFFPVNTLSGFAFEGVERDASPLNLKVRLYPTTTLSADLRLNYDT